MKCAYTGLFRPFDGLPGGLYLLLFRENGAMGYFRAFFGAFWLAYLPSLGRISSFWQFPRPGQWLGLGWLRRVFGSKPVDFVSPSEKQLDRR